MTIPTESRLRSALHNNASSAGRAGDCSTSALAYARLGLKHAVIPGDAAFTDEGIEAAWIDGTPVSAGAFCQATECAVREHARRFPEGALARDLARLDARASAKATRVASQSFSRTHRARSSYVRRAPRRVRRRVVVRGARITRCTDPPEPPSECYAGHPALEQHSETRGTAPRLGAWRSPGRDSSSRRTRQRRSTWAA